MPDTQNNIRTEKSLAAMIGAAVGDALGWPFEDRARPSGADDPRKSPSLTFRPWSKTVGGRFNAFLEPIQPGEYSDDTQLILATARAELAGPAWWDRLTQIELPSWLMYERGGGGATKRAAQAWLKGLPPWKQATTTDVRRYFEAGGNGAAMRILPHILAHPHKDQWPALAERVVRNSITTHGHPRAILGALCYASAVAVALAETRPLSYGGLIEMLLAEKRRWSSPDVLNSLPTEWLAAADRALGERYVSLWDQTAAELIEMLRRCQGGMDHGALFIDQDILRDLGCFDRAVNGAGTVAAVASVFVASRYAVEPSRGLQEVAFARGADTDTLASMTGAILGAVCGRDWLSSLERGVQDQEYIRQLGETLQRNEAPRADKPPARAVHQRDLDRFVDAIIDASRDASLVFPDGRYVRVVEDKHIQGRSTRTRVRLWKLRADDGQTLYVRKISKASGKEDWPAEPEGVDVPTTDITHASQHPRINLSLVVADLAKSKAFYEKALGLQVEKATSSFVNLGHFLVLFPRSSHHTAQEAWRGVNQRAVICVECKSLEDTMDRLAEMTDTRIIQPMEVRGALGSFRCLDPDGNVVEVWQEIR